MSVLKWIKERYIYPEFDGRKIRNILHFSLVWNIFERECCQCNAQINTHSNQIALALQSDTIPSLEKTWYYFQNRYVANAQTTEVFNSFEFNSGRRELVSAILRSQSPSQAEKTEALLRIIFRLRNNLMHGDKEPNMFYEQDINFKHANAFLMDICNLYHGQRCPEYSQNRNNS
ncbi:hypothetical protein [Sulfuricurvum sp.]|uniref:hypothetical protein n=1 Tax=Sulfuricurvum sp. TaxID=2025608 RepID=UPI003C43AB19